AVGLVRGRAAHGPHLREPHRHAPLGNLPGGLRACEAAADDMNGPHAWGGRAIRGMSQPGGVWHPRGVMRVAGGVVRAGLLASGPAAAGDVDPAVATAFQGWGLPVPSAGSLIYCHGYNCNFRTQIGISAADRAQLAALMEPGRASPDAERRAIAKTEAWFAKRVAPQTGTQHAKARASVGWGIGGDPGQFDCVDTTANTTSLLVVLSRLGLLRHHDVSTPISRLLAGGPHFTATMQEKRSSQRWTVDPWTHDNGELPDVFTV